LYEEVASQKAKLMADMQGLIQIVEDDRKRQIEEFAKAYHREHIVVYHENPLSMPQTIEKDRPRYGLRLYND